MIIPDNTSYNNLAHFSITCLVHSNMSLERDRVSKKMIFQIVVGHADIKTDNSFAIPKLSFWQQITHLLCLN
jgi:hypothetical protein